MVVTISIELAMDHKPSHRELASVLISDLYQKVISQRDIGKGRERMHWIIQGRQGVVFLEDFKTPKGHFEINWPLQEIQMNFGK